MSSGLSRSDIVLWVHTCPQREQNLEELKRSLSDSDVGEYEVLVCPAVGQNAIEQWNRETLRDLASRYKYVVRIEDDTVVNAHMMHNIMSWPALSTGQDFGLGLLHLNNIYWIDSQFKYRISRDRSSGSLWFDAREICGGQGQIFRSEVYLDSIYPRLPLLTGGEMDVGMTAAAYDAGLRTYVMFPDLVEQSSIAAESLLGHSHTEQFYKSNNFLPDFKYEGDRQFDGRPISVTGKNYSAYFVNSKKQILAVSASLTNPRAELPSGAIVASRRGTPVIVKTKNVFWSLAEAKRFAGAGWSMIE
jgi:hypothetical protein